MRVFTFSLIILEIYVKFYTENPRICYSKKSFLLIQSEMISRAKEFFENLTSTMNEDEEV